MGAREPWWPLWFFPVKWWRLLVWWCESQGEASPGPHSGDCRWDMFGNAFSLVLLRLTPFMWRPESEPLCAALIGIKWHCWRGDTCKDKRKTTYLKLYNHQVWYIGVPQQVHIIYSRCLHIYYHDLNFDALKKTKISFFAHHQFKTYALFDWAVIIIPLENY